MRELLSDAPVATLTVAELEELIEQVIERREARQRIAKPNSTTRASRQQIAEIIKALQADGSGGRLLERLLAARAEDLAREC